MMEHKLQDEFTKQLNQVLTSLGITQQFGFPGALNEKGHSYKTLHIGGIKEQTESTPMFINAKAKNFLNLAVQQYVYWILKEIKEDKHIVWRAKPTLQEETYSDGPMWPDGKGEELIHLVAIRSRLSHYASKEYFDSFPDTV